MLEKLKKNKTLLSILTLLVFVIIGVIAGLCIHSNKKDESEVSKKNEIKIESGSNETDNPDKEDKNGKADKTDTDSDSDELYNGDGLEVQKKDDGTVEDRTDVYDIWGGDGDSVDSNSQGSSDNSEEEKPEKEKPQEEKQEEKPEEDILVDDKDWGRIF